MPRDLPPGAIPARGFNWKNVQFAPRRVAEFADLKYGKSLVTSTRRVGPVPIFGTNGQCGCHADALVSGPGIVLGRKGQGPLGVEWCDGPFWVIDTAYFAAVDEAQADPKWFYYVTKYVGLNHLKSGEKPGLQRSVFLAQLFPFPEKPTQTAIARVLGTLDGKIELNRQMNRTLEATAQAIFKSWFVDFDAVIAKVAGRKPFGMDATTAALFPDRFVESEIGLIPKGWRSGPIYSVADVIYGFPFASRLFNAEGRGLPLVRIRDLATHDPEVFTEEASSRATRVTAGDIVVGMDGEFRAHLWRGPDALLNQRMCKFLPRDGASSAFVYFSILEPLADFERSKVGTTVIHLGKADIDTFRILLPGEEILARFGRIVDPMLRLAVLGGAESRDLAALRDLLLPKLLSGEVRLKSAEKLVEATHP